MGLACIERILTGPRLAGAIPQLGGPVSGRAPKLGPCNALVYTIHAHQQNLKETFNLLTQLHPTRVCEPLQKNRHEILFWFAWVMLERGLAFCLHLNVKQGRWKSIFCKMITARGNPKEINVSGLCHSRVPCAVVTFVFWQRTHTWNRQYVPFSF